jgi:hypothetical protein
MKMPWEKQWPNSARCEKIAATSKSAEPEHLGDIADRLNLTISLWGCDDSVCVVTFVMAWSPIRRTNAG